MMNGPGEHTPPAPDPQTLVPPPSAPPAEVIRQQATSQDYAVLRLAVFGLIILAAIALIGSMALLFNSKDVPDGVIAIGSGAVGALATMLVRPPNTPPSTVVVAADRRGTGTGG